MLSVQKSPSDKSGLGFVEGISVSTPHSTNFVPSSSFEPPVSEVVSETVKPVEVTPSRKIKVDLKESKPKKSTLSKDKLMVSLLGFVIFVESLGTFVQTASSCKLLSEQLNQKYLCLKHKIPWYLLENW